MHFLRKFKKALRESNSHLIIGLDTNFDKIPDFLKSEANPIAEFNKLIVQTTLPFCCGYKFNIAFYEKDFALGFDAIKATLAEIPDNFITIADAKRGDIESTTELYAQTYFDLLKFDSITVQPYMGQDSVRPFLRRKNKFIWLLALTSNYGANDFQFLKVNDKPLWEIVVKTALNWNAHKIGFVFGANHLKEIYKMTNSYPDIPLLIPGIGAQKNSLQKTMQALNHNLFIINQSRSIIYTANNAGNKDEFISIIFQAAKNANAQINQLI